MRSAPGDALVTTELHGLPIYFQAQVKGTRLGMAVSAPLIWLLDFLLCCTGDLLRAFHAALQNSPLNTKNPAAKVRSGGGAVFG